MKKREDIVLYPRNISAQSHFFGNWKLYRWDENGVKESARNLPPRQERYSSSACRSDILTI
jgi:hypothetical protein